MSLMKTSYKFSTKSALALMLVALTPQLVSAARFQCSNFAECGFDDQCNFALVATKAGLTSAESFRLIVSFTSLQKELQHTDDATVAENFCLVCKDPRRHLVVPNTRDRRSTVTRIPTIKTAKSRLTNIKAAAA